MINSKEDLKRYLAADKIALNIKRRRPRLLGDAIWKYQIALRKYEYYLNTHNKSKWGG
jgi:serine O-acetyltransferase